MGRAKPAANYVLEYVTTYLNLQEPFYFAHISASEKIDCDIDAKGSKLEIFHQSV